MLHVHQQAKMAKEISPDDGLLHLGDEKHPLKLTTKAEVES